MKFKKGEMSTKQIVTLIILITSFLILLYFLFFFNPADASDEEICRNSVALRSGAGVIDSEVVPLDCKTSYVCFTEDGSCEKMTNPEKIKVESKEDVYYGLAEEMRKCWWMFGEGKLKYISDEIKGNNLYCSICSQVTFDDSILELEGFSSGEIDRKEFFDYLASKKIEGSSETYMDYLIGTNNVEGMEDLLEEQNSSFGSINLRKSQYVVMGAYSEGSDVGKVLVGALGLLIVIKGVVLAIPSGGSSLGLVWTGVTLVAGAAGGYFIGNAIEGESGSMYLAPTILEVNSKQFNSLDCEDVKTLS